MGCSGSKENEPSNPMADVNVQAAAEAAQAETARAAVEEKPEPPKYVAPGIPYQGFLDKQGGNVQVNNVSTYLIHFVKNLFSSHTDMEKSFFQFGEGCLKLL